MALRFVGLVLAILATALSGCDSPGGGTLLRQGIGTDLSHSGLAQATTLQDRYVALICRQAGLGAFASEEDCADQGFRAAEWSAFVQAGMNDIDARCDAYLAWLDERRRSAGPILQQISDLRTATTAILALSGVGVDPIAIVSAAFGLASGTFTNVNGRLLLQLDQSTVQAVVLSRQTEFRQMLRAPDQRIANRPDAIHVLRSYLRICSPFTIETDINTTITTLARGGAAAVDRQAPLVETTPSVALRPEAPFRQPPRAPQPRIDPYTAIVTNYNPNVHTEQRVGHALAVVCVHGRERGTVPAHAAELIAIYERAIQVSATPGIENRKFDPVELSEIAALEPCARMHLNYFERANFRDGAIGAFAAGQLNRFLPETDRIAAGTRLEAARSEIAAARRAFVQRGGRLTNKGAFFADHVTDELLSGT
jgi:hypothetical protein